jgi:hypothetical protein
VWAIPPPGGFVSKGGDMRFFAFLEKIVLGGIARAPVETTSEKNLRSQRI